jgi:4-amino-4-deoxy-L-arabinose transferase-like glycosyltransferase
MLKSELVAPLAIGTVKANPKFWLITTDWIAWFFLVVVGTIPVLALWGKSTYLTGDSYQYLRAALSFSQSQGLRDMSGAPFTVLGPLYPLLIGIAHRIFESINVETTARLIGFAGAMVAVIAFYSLLRIRFSLPLSLLTASLFALMPLRVWIGLFALSEGLYVGLLMLGLALFFRSSARAWMVGLAGAVLGLAYLTRPEGILCFAGIGILSLFHRAHRAKKTLLLGAGFLVMALPYHAWVYRETGTPSSSRFQILLAQSEAIYQGNIGSVFVFNQANSDGTASPVLRPQMSFSVVARRYFFFARLEIERLLHLLGPRLLVSALLTLGGGILLYRTVRRSVSGFTFVDTWPVILTSWLLFLPLFHVEDRYLLQVMPAFQFSLALVIEWLYKLVALKIPQRSKASARLIPLALIAAFILSYGYRLTTQLPKEDESLLARSTARWLETQKLSPAPIFSQGPDLAFFFGSKHLWMANGEPEDVLRYARRAGAGYIYVTSRDVPTPLTSVLLGNEEHNPPSLKLLYEMTDGSARSRLFKLN